MYIRKTEDQYSIVSDYGQGYELTCYCDNYQDAKNTWKDYKLNQPEYSHKIRKQRVRII